MWWRKRKETAFETAKRISTDLFTFSKLPLPDLFYILNTNDQGLTEAEAEERLERFGLNEIVHERAPSWFTLLLKNFKNPFNLLLLLLAAVSWFLGEMDAVVIIVIMVALSIVMRFTQEYRSNRAAEKLKEMVSTKATVLRRKLESDHHPTPQEIEMKYLVPGDIIHLSSGDMLPGDARILTAKDLFVSQSALTGETMPIEKDEVIPNIPEENPVELKNLCFMGTNVLNGTARALIVATGNQTFFGSMAKTLTGYRPLTSFDIGVNKVSWLLIQFMFVMVPVVFLINGFTKGDWGEAFLFSLAVAVGLTPELLPMIVTTNLARGAINMSKKKVIVKRLNAIQNFGAMNILCTDKTGTLTENKIILDRYLNPSGKEDDFVLNYAYLNSFYQTGLKNLLDNAVLEHTEVNQRIAIDKDFKKVDEVPFDFTRRRMSVVVENRLEKQILICKGAVDEVFRCCERIRIDGSVVPFTEEIRQSVHKINDDLNEDGLRVLGVAYKDISAKKKAYEPSDENQLTLLGLLAFLDPPKATATNAIANLHQNNVEVKILTGDNELVTRKICQWVKLPVTGVLTGTQVETLTEEELKRAALNTSIFVKLSPTQKARLIAALKLTDNVVGYLGDGINDAPALREADIGISVDTGVDIAKESADIIMLEKSLLFLSEGVLEGRKTFGNIIKYIKMAVSSNFGNVFSVLGASAWLPFLPMLPVQLLVQNLLYDFSQTTIPFDAVDQEFIIKPRKWQPGGIARFMIFIGPISSIFDYTTFALMFFFFGANTPEKQALFQSGWFVEGLLSQTLIVHMIRTQKIPFIQSIASWPLLISTLIIMGIGIYIPYSFFGKSIGFVSLPILYYPWLVATLLCYCVLTQLIKVWFIHRFKYWL